MYSKTYDKVVSEFRGLSFAVALLSTVLLAVPSFAQTTALSEVTDPSNSSSSWRKRHNSLIGEIRRDVEKLSRPRQARALARLADVLWETDQQQARIFLKESVDISFDPKTEYRTERHRIDAITSLYVHDRLIDKDETLGNRLRNELKATLIDRKGPSDLSINSTAIFLANFLYKRDKNLSFDFALRSLAYGRPAIDSNATQFYLQLRKADSALASQYFENLVSSVIDSNNQDLVKDFLEKLRQRDDEPFDEFSFQVSELEIQKVVNALRPVLENETELLTAGNKTDCELAKSLRRLISRVGMQVDLIQAAIGKCKESKYISVWEKPNFLKGRELKTSQNFLDLAKSIPDADYRDFYIYAAALKARDEKKYRLAIDILDGLDFNSKYRTDLGWKWTRIQVGAKLVSDLIAEKNYLEINRVVDEFPTQLRPYFLLDIVSTYARSGMDSSFIDGLRKRAKTEILRLDFPLPTLASGFDPANPSKFLSLVNTFNVVRANEEAVKTFDEFIVLQNLLSSRVTGRTADGSVISYSNTSLPKHFIESNYEHVITKLSEINSTPIRLDFRLNVLWLTTRNGSIGGGGITVLE